MWCHVVCCTVGGRGVCCGVVTARAVVTVTTVTAGAVVTVAARGAVSPVATGLKTLFGHALGPLEQRLHAELDAA